MVTLYQSMYGWMEPSSSGQLEAAIAVSLYHSMYGQLETLSYCQVLVNCSLLFIMGS